MVLSHFRRFYEGLGSMLITASAEYKTIFNSVCSALFVVGVSALEHDVALSSSLVAMYSTVASNCLYNAWPDNIISCPELKAYVHYDSKCCGLVLYVYLWGNLRQLILMEIDRRR